ncbi:tetratricopeptide repeat protein [Prosthecobacter sp.]|uniref:tetratricopeptide repeat protein n=1 Tax=Prosthecobacter sp. TaxID=1965333 RepID=UPI003782ED3F
MSARIHLSFRSLVSATVFIGAAASLTAGDFATAVSEARKEHYKFAPIAAETLVMEDKLDEALQVFVKAVPDAQLTAADCMVLGEFFVRLDDAKSLAYYRRANDLLPDEPETNLALAQSVHRAGRYTEASIYYKQFLAAVPDSGRFAPYALQAECLARARKDKEAVEHWEKAAPADNETGIAHAIFEVHGPASPLRRRADLLKAVAEGQTAKVEDLMVLSATWDLDWWNSQVNQAFLRRDLELAKKVLASEPQRLAELTLYASTYLEPNITTEWLKKELESGGWLIGESGKLPASTRVAERLINLAVKHRLTDVPALTARFEKELRMRSFGEGAKDPAAVHLLAGLMMNSGKARPADLTALKRAGWQYYHDPVLAGGYLADKLNENKLTTKNFDLRHALTEFPQDSLLCMLEVILAKEESEPLRDPLLAAIPAEFAQLSASVGTVRDISRLNGLFNLLKEDLALPGRQIK